MSRKTAARKKTDALLRRRKQQEKKQASLFLNSPAVEMSKYLNPRKKSKSAAEKSDDERKGATSKQILTALSKIFNESPFSTEDKTNINNNIPAAMSEVPGLCLQGLRGGAGGGKVVAKQGLKLMNNTSSLTQNICFVNSTVQLFRNTGYANFLMTEVAPSINQEQSSGMKGCRALINLYSESSTRARSAAVLRKCVANHSGREYLCDGTQQDAEEFLRCMVEMISSELKNNIAFSSVVSNHWGEETTRRVFLDNPPDGSCKKCGQYPSSSSEEFMTLKLTVPVSGLETELESLLAATYSESTETVQMKCSNCCIHEQQSVLCTQTGFCSRPAALQKSLTKYPAYLFIQLLRFASSASGIKVSTHVKIGEEIVFSNGYKYEVLGFLNHKGRTVQAGHFVTFMKSDLGQWILFDDDKLCSSTLDEADSPDNYIIFCKKTENEQPGIANISDPAKGPEWEIYHHDPDLAALSQINKKDPNKVDDIVNEAVQKVDKDISTNHTFSKRIKLSDENLDEAIRNLETCTKKTAEEIKELRRLKNNRTKRKSRNAQNEEQKVKRLKKMREYTKNVRNVETEEEKLKRLKKIREYTKNVRNVETEEEKAKRLKEHREQVKGNSILSRRQKFKDRIRWGPSYPCITCHQTLFSHQVTELHQQMEEDLKKVNNRPFFQQCFSKPEHFFKIIEKDGDKTSFCNGSPLDKKSKCFVCRVCLGFLKKGKVPPKADINCLEAVFVPQNLKLQSYLEQALIARVLLFIKIFSLRTSLMPAIKDKCVVIPLDRKEVVDTIQNLPRLPSETNIIDIQWKRRLGQKNAHLQAKVNPDRLFRALEFLKSKGNKYYQASQNLEEYKSRCGDDDPDGFRVLFGSENDENSGKIIIKFVPDYFSEPIHDLELFQQLSRDGEEEEEFLKKDVVRKFQIDYNETVCMVEKFPEAMCTDGVVNHDNQNEIVNEDDLTSPIEKLTALSHNSNKSNHNDADTYNQLHVVAPGEGKDPVDMTFCQDWDVKAFPMLHPDGLNHLSDDRRAINLSEMEYFRQRLFNHDSRWRDNTHWVFASAVYKEKKDLKRNIDLAYKHGKRKTNTDGKTSYSLDDPFSVFQNIANTPAYHKKGKMEMMARLDNLGPFHVFFTLSCADYRWPENLMSILSQRGIGLRCHINIYGTDEYEVQSGDEWIPLDDYLDTIDETLHEIIRKNIVTATRNYQQRVQTLMTTVIRNPSNPLSVKHFSSKLEFAARGAGHQHGVLWLDIHKIERKVDTRQLDHLDPHQLPALRLTINNKPNFCYTDHYLKDPSNVIEGLDKFAVYFGLDNDIPHSKGKSHITLRYLKKLQKKKNLSLREKEVFDALRLLFPLYGLQCVLKKMNKKEEVTDEELDIVVCFVDTFSTVSLHPAIVGPVAAAIASQVNTHSHTKTCRKYNTKCRFKFPKLPSYTTIVAKPPPKEMSSEDKKALEKKHEEVLKKVKDVIEDDKVIENILEQFPKHLENNVTDAIRGKIKVDFLSSEKLYFIFKGREQRIDALLEKAGLGSEEGKEMYVAALGFSSSGYSLVMARDIDELWVNSYNPEITIVWDGNTDFQFCFDFYAIIAYISEYFTKDDTGVVKTLTATLKAAECDDLKSKMKLLSNTWIRNRQMGEAEAVYKLVKDFHFRDSDTVCVFVQTCKKSERSKMLKNVTGKEEFKHMPKITIENKEGEEYIEQYDLHSKYERRPKEDPALKYLTFSHMAKMFKPYWGKKLEEEKEFEDNLEDVSDEVETFIDPPVVSQPVTEEPLRTVNGVEATTANISLAKELTKLTLRKFLSVLESLPDEFKKLSLRQIHQLSKQ